MGSILNFVSIGDEVGNGHNVFVKENPSLRFMHNTFTDLIRYESPDKDILINEFESIKLSNLISYTQNLELKSDCKNIIVYEVWDLNWLILHESYLLNYILNNLNEKCIEYLNNNKLKIILSNIGEASILDMDFFKKFEKYINSKGFSSKNFIFIDGNFDLNKIDSNFKIYTPNHFLSIVPDMIGMNQLGYESSQPTIEDVKTKTNRRKHFLSFNRAERVHRGVLVSHIIKNNLLNKFHLSALREFEESVHYNDPRISQYKPYITKINNIVPIQIDTHKYKNENMDFWPGNCFDKELFLDSYFHLCTETFFFENGVTFFTEKMLKPIIGLQPFIVMGSYKYLDNLKKLGFKTFENIFDESYDMIEDPFDRILAILELIDEICSWDLETCHEKYKSVLDICIYNHNHLYNNIKDDNEIFKMIKNIADEW